MLKEVLEKNNTILSYKGDLNYDKIGDLLKEYEAEVESYGFKRGLKKKVYSIIVELLENVVKHGYSCSEKGDRHVEFVLLIEGEHIRAKCSNFIPTSNIKVLNKRLNLINKLNKKYLNRLLNYTITNKTISDVGGAGLGLIMISKYSENKITHDIEETENPKHSLLTVEVLKEINNGKSNKRSN